MGESLPNPILRSEAMQCSARDVDAICIPFGADSGEREGGREARTGKEEGKRSRSVNRQLPFVHLARTVPVVLKVTSK